MGTDILLHKLREATREKHAALEAVMTDSDEAMSLEGYQMLLNTNLLFIHTVLPLFEESSEFSERLKWLKAGIESDMRELSVEARDHLFDFDLSDSRASHGVRYVLEGSSLGNKVILKQLESQAWAKPLVLNFLRKADMKRWKEFRQSLNEVNSSDHDLVTRGAVQAFDLFREIALWYRSSQSVDPVPPIVQRGY